MNLRVYLEETPRRSFACAVDWPGWCRSGKTSEAAVESLLGYGDRYRAAMGELAADLQLEDVDVEIVQRLNGGASTEFGVPGEIADVDRRDLSAAELASQVALLDRAHQAFAAIAARAEGRALATGPRGGGRSLDKIREHVRGGEEAYVRALGGGSMTMADALAAKVRGELAERGPRGGERWPARYAIRRAAWHVLDHAWEIEDRLTG